MICSVCNRLECTQPASLCERDQTHLLISALKRASENASKPDLIGVLQPLMDHFKTRGGWVSASTMRRLLKLYAHGEPLPGAHQKAIDQEYNAKLALTQAQEWASKGIEPL